MEYQYSGSVIPSGWNGSTYLNPVVRTYTDLTQRIKLQLGWPIMSVEVLDCAIYDNINMAIEMYSRYAGYTEEYLVFDSQAYSRGNGIRMDQVFTYLGSTYRTQLSAVSASFYDFDAGIPDDQGVRGDYRKVSSVFSFDGVDRTGLDSLFTIDYIFASQVYFNYMQNFGGFDLVTWQTLKEWMEVREKLFSTKVHYMFNARSQMLKLLPEPTAQGRYIGVIGCYVEKPIRQILPEQWVQKYALALTKILTGQVRGKFQGVTLLGGGAVNYNDILSQGLEERNKLETDLMEKPGEANPVSFFIG